jgi:hypothetical protein
MKALLRREHVSKQRKEVRELTLKPVRRVGGGASTKALRSGWA